MGIIFRKNLLFVMGACLFSLPLSSCKPRNQSSSGTAFAGSGENLVFDVEILQRLASQIKREIEGQNLAPSGYVDVVVSKCSRGWSSEFLPPSDPNAPTAGGIYQMFPAIKIIFKTKENVLNMVKYSFLFGSNTSVWDPVTQQTQTALLCGGLQG